MPSISNTDALVAGLAWLPWSEEHLAECPPALVQFFERLRSLAPTAPGKSAPQQELFDWLAKQARNPKLEGIHWFEVGLNTMLASNAFAAGAPAEIAEAALGEFRRALRDAGFSNDAKDRATALVRALASSPADPRIFERLLQEITGQSRAQPVFRILGARQNPWAAGSYFLMVATVATAALTAASSQPPAFALPLIVGVGLVSATLIGALGALRE